MKAGWQQTTLGSIAQVGAGNSAPQGDALFADGVHPFFRTSDAGRVRFGDIVKSTDYLNDDGIKGLRRYPAGTILFPKSGASTFLNHRVMMGVDGFVSSHLATIVGDESRVDRRYLLYFLSTIFAQDLVQDHAYPSLNLPLISSIPVVLPSLPEQQRIVGILDAAFDGIATAKANAEKNLQNARALFESHLQSVFAQREGEWGNHRALEELTLPDSPITYGVVKPGPEGEIIFVRGGDITAGRILINQLRTITKAFSDQYRRTLLRGGELLISLVGQPGQVAVVPADLAGANIARQVGLIRLQSIMNVEFVRYFLQSPIGQELLGARQSGSVQQVINLGELRQVAVPVPSLQVQTRVVENLANLSKETQRLESLYQRKLTALDELKKSLLHQAFSGML